MHKQMDVTEIFGSNVFNDRVMKERLPRDTYKALKKTIQEGLPLSLDVANVVASDPFRAAFVRLRSEHGLYREQTSAVTFLTPTIFRTGIPLPGISLWPPRAAR